MKYLPVTINTSYPVAVNQHPLIKLDIKVDDWSDSRSGRFTHNDKSTSRHYMGLGLPQCSFRPCGGEETNLNVRAGNLT
jgi:hypothetical protein